MKDNITKEILLSTLKHYSKQSKCEVTVVLPKEKYIYLNGDMVEYTKRGKEIDVMFNTSEIPDVVF